MDWTGIVASSGCVIVGLAMATVSVGSRMRWKRWSKLSDDEVRALAPRPPNVTVVEVPGELGGAYVDLGTSEESPATLSAEPTLVSQTLELKGKDGERVVLPEGTKLKVEKIVGARRDLAGPAVTGAGGTIVRRFGFQVAPGTKLWLQGGPARGADAPSPYREGARVVGGDCVLSGEEIIEKTWTDPRTEDGCLVGCAAPFVVVLVATGAWAATVDKEWWTWVALVTLLGGLGLAKILEPTKAPAR